MQAPATLPPIPAPVRDLLARLPQFPPSAVFAAALTLQLGESMGTDAHPEFAGKIIRLHISDAGVTLTFRVTPHGFAPSASANADLTLTATAQDFMTLALRREDPDTLFFSRRLMMEGDTEFGLFVKNSLDALEFKPSLPPPRVLLRALRALLP
jgi:O2-independent ubiquinone biosynthesis accessory factor UbiT